MNRPAERPEPMVDVVAPVATILPFPGPESSRLPQNHTPIGSMKRFPLMFLLLSLIPAQLWAAAPIAANAENLSFKKEVDRAIARGADFLAGSQNTNGWWSTPDHPSVTALALFATLGEPKARLKDSPGVAKGFQFVLSCAKPNGGIHAGELANYNTSISMMALLAADRPEYEPVILRAREFVAGSQVRPGQAPAAYVGGIGYSHDEGISDMNNTLVALEALYHSKHLVTDRGGGAVETLNWKAAQEFVQHCQNLPGSNTQPWTSGDPADRGGFVYDPENSKAGSVTNANGKVALRSYGSISYAGLLSYIYADVKRDDARVQAVLEWLNRHATLEENPGLGPQGYFYYLHLMCKALTAAGVDELQTPDGKRIDWRREVAMKLINLQAHDGAWQNENGRWWEKDKNLVTSYAMITLEMIGRHL